MTGTAVLLVSFGGPRSMEEIPRFLKSLTGRDLPPAAQQAVIDRYRSIGGYSPLPRIAEAQAELLAGEANKDLLIIAAFRYSHPTLEEEIGRCAAAGIDRILFLVMSPFFTSRTVGDYMRAAEQHLAALSYRPETLFIHSWYRERLFIDCWVNKIREEACFDDACYLFSAHSLPAALSNEPYKAQVEETVGLIAGALSLSRYRLGWQSVPQNPDGPWLQPAVETVIDEIAETGVKKIVQVPVGFVTDHLETLYDIDQVHREYAVRKGLAHYRISSLNVHPLFIAALRHIIEKRLRETS